MNIEMAWEGRLPNYWDITQWSVIWKDKLYFLNKQMGERSLLTLDLKNMELSKLRTTSNVMLGIYNELIVIGRVLDARSHITLLNVTAYNIHSFQKAWTIKEQFLFEKYRVPYINGTNPWIVGKRLIDLETGNVDAFSYEFKSNIDLKIKQKKGFDFQGMINDQCFYLHYSKDVISIVDLNSAQEKTIEIVDLKHVLNKGIKGKFDLGQISHTNNSTITNVLINRDCVVWITNKNNVVVHFYKIARTIEIENGFNELDLCLNSITDREVIIYGIKSYEEGSILIINLGDL
jgi:hypothetical protein